MTDAANQHPTVVSQAQPNPPERAWDVTRFGIKVTRVWNQALQFHVASEVGGNLQDTHGLATVMGVLARSGDGEFTAVVKWDCKEMVSKKAMVLDGTVAMTFAHKPGLPEAGVNYYCQVNAPILAYPYIREIVAHVTAGLPGGPVILEPLDVPQFTQKATKAWLAVLLKQQEEKAGSGEQVNDGSTDRNAPAL